MKKISDIIKKVNKDEKGISTIEFILILFVFGFVLSSIKFYFLDFMYAPTKDGRIGFAERVVQNVSSTLSDSDNLDTDQDEGNLIVQTGYTSFGCVQVEADYFICNDTLND